MSTRRTLRRGICLTPLSLVNHTAHYRYANALKNCLFLQIQLCVSLWSGTGSNRAFITKLSAMSGSGQGMAMSIRNPSSEREIGDHRIVIRKVWIGTSMLYQKRAWCVENVIKLFI